MPEPDITNTVALERVTLIYHDEQARTHTQPLSDITTAGTLIDPNTGDDLELVSALIADVDQDATPSRAWDNTVPRELAGVLEDREDERSVQAAEWLAEHENDDEVWDLIGSLLDRITQMADPVDG